MSSAELDLRRFEIPRMAVCRPAPGRFILCTYDYETKQSVVWQVVIEVGGQQWRSVCEASAHEDTRHGIAAARRRYLAHSRETNDSAWNCRTSRGSTTIGCQQNMARPLRTLQPWRHPCHAAGSCALKATKENERETENKRSSEYRPVQGQRFFL